MDYDEAALQTVRETRFLIDRYDDWLFARFSLHLGRRIVEIGCGLGNQIQRLLDRELVVGIETSTESVAVVQQRFADHPNIQARAVSITDPRVLELAASRFDTALSLNVFEHIDDDVLALANTRRLLQPGGRLILIVPAHQFFYGTMDRAIGHYRRYSKRDLAQKLGAAGFELLSQEYANMVGGLGWFVNGRVLRKSVPPAGQLRMLNLVMPFLEKVESRLPVPFGVSIISISQAI